MPNICIFSLAKNTRPSFSHRPRFNQTSYFLAVAMMLRLILWRRRSFLWHGLPNLRNTQGLVEWPYYTWTQPKASRQLITSEIGRWTAKSWIDLIFKHSFFTKTLWEKVVGLPPQPHCLDHLLEKVILARGPLRKDVLHVDPKFGKAWGPVECQTHTISISQSFHIWSSSSSIWFF